MVYFWYESGWWWGREALSKDAHGPFACWDDIFKAWVEEKI